MKMTMNKYGFGVIRATLSHQHRRCRLLARFSAEPATLFRRGLLRRNRRLARCFFFRSRFFLRCRLFHFCLCALGFYSFWLWFGLFPFRLFLFYWLCLDYLRHIHPLYERHRSGVAPALAKFHDARVSAIALGRPWRDVVKQFLHRILLTQSRKSAAARMNRSVFPESNHSLCERSNGLGLGQGGLDTLMFDQRTNLIRKQRLPVLSRATKFDRLFLMPHGVASIRGLTGSLSGSGSSGLAGAITAHRHVDQARFESHSQPQTKLLQFVLDFV